MIFFKNHAVQSANDFFQKSCGTNRVFVFAPGFVKNYAVAFNPAQRGIFGRNFIMAFTTWAALKTQMLNDLAAGSWRTKTYQNGDWKKEFNTFEDFRKALDYVTDQAAVEAGTASRRTYAKNGGRTSS
jgi:hypothetical protein